MQAVVTAPASPDPQPASCRRSFRRGFRARAAPRLDTAGVLGRTSSLFRAALVRLAGACVPTPGAAGAAFEFVAHLPLRWTRGRLWHPRRRRCTRGGLGDRCTPRRMYVPGILSSQPSQADGTVPERRANVQRERAGTDGVRTVSRLGGRRKDAGTRWLGCCPPEMSSKRPAKTPLRRRAAPHRVRPARSALAICDPQCNAMSSFRPHPGRGEWQPALRFRSLDVRASENVGPAVRTHRRQRQPYVDDELRLTAQALTRHRLPTLRRGRRQMRTQ